MESHCQCLHGFAVWHASNTALQIADGAWAQVCSFRKLFLRQARGHAVLSKKRCEWKRRHGGHILDPRANPVDGIIAARSLT
jgi:hypothetical protein